MERVYGAHVERYASGVARHLYQAGVAADPEKTVRFLTLAADQALGLRMAEALGDPRAHREALERSAWHHFYCMRSPEAAELALRAAELLRAAGDLWNMAEMLAQCQQWSVLAGRLDAVAQVGEKAETLSQRFGHMGRSSMLCWPED